VVIEEEDAIRLTQDWTKKRNWKRFSYASSPYHCHPDTGTQYVPYMHPTSMGGEEEKEMRIQRHLGRLKGTHCAVRVGGRRQYRCIKAAGRVSK